MSRNGSGVYSLPAGNPVVTGTTISSTWANNTLSDMATALTGSVASDGQTAMTGNLQMGNNKITGLANGTNAQDAVTYSQLTGLAPATSGSSVLAGNGAGGFTNVTLATGLTYSGGTLTANINTLLPDQSGKSGYVLTTDGSTTSWGTAGGNGTVTSVALSGGTTGLTVSGSPITSSGTITLAGTVAVTHGGTGSTTADGAVANLLPSQTSNSGKFLTTNGTTTSWASAGTGTVTSVALSGGTTGLTVSGSPITTSGTMTLSGKLAIGNGGTNATSAPEARTNLGLGALATLNTVGASQIDSNAVTTAKITDANVTPAKLSQPFTRTASVSTTSGTSVDISTTIPSWARRISVILNGVSTNGTSNLLIQVGSSSFTTSGYTSGASTGGNTRATSTAGFLATAANTAASLNAGAVVLYNITGTSWTASGMVSDTDDGRIGGTGGTVTLSGALDRVRITTVNGTDTFDAGFVGLIYEG